jgi:hypothetical protein
VKAHLLSLLDKGDRHCFNKVWESCANMEKYVQMGFATDERKEIFGDDCLNVLCFTCLKEQLTAYIPDEDEKSIFYLISPSSEKRKENKEGDNQSPKPFNSIINFPNFLLHVLRVMKNSCKDIPLDDKKLIETFKNKITNADDVKKFAFALLKCKYLFDHYIIKIDSSGIASDADGKWCLLRCKLDGSYKNTFGEDQEYNNGENLRILMLLSAFHVSESSMQRKHWLNAALQYLHDCQEPVNAKDYLEHLESIAKCFVFDRILADKDDMQDYDAIIYGENNPRKINRCCTNIGSKISYGNIQNNFIFNYLDYLLWVNNKKYEKFRFTSRNSVEHFLPQDTTYSEKASEEVIDCFGNLCLIHKSDNSSFSNHSPKEKQNSYKGKKIRSIKQDLMMNHVEENKEWDSKSIKEHEEKMINLLMAQNFSHPLPSV